MRWTSGRDKRDDIEVEYVAGVDGGGSKTVAAIVDSDGTILGVGRASVANHLVVGYDRAAMEVEAGLRMALQSAKCNLEQVKVVSVGLAGLGRAPEVEVMRSKLGGYAREGRLLLDHDAAIALAGATCLEPGVVVISGTGSIGFGENRRGKKARAGGWGRLASDEGSAYWLGRRLLSRAFEACDGRSPGTMLTETVLKHLGCGNVEELVGRLSTLESRPGDVSALAPLVTEAASVGDASARELLCDAGTELGKLAVAVIRALGMCDEPFDVAYSGSVFEKAPCLLETFTERVLDAARAGRVVPARLPSVLGAILLAARAAGWYTTKVVEGLCRGKELVL